MWNGRSPVGIPSQVRFPGAARDFSPRVNFQSRLAFGVRPPACAIACIYTCAHVKDPVVHVRIRWIMETLKHPACTVGWVARLYRSWLSPGKATRISHGKKSHWDNTVVNFLNYFFFKLNHARFFGPGGLLPRARSTQSPTRKLLIKQPTFTFAT